MNPKSKSVSPSKKVLQMFGVSSEPILLDGGEGQSYLADSIVFKPMEDDLQTNWIAEVLHNINAADYRLIKPVKTIDGKWMYDGWHAFHFIEGEIVKGRWIDKINVSRNFHTQLSGIKRPDFIGKRKIPWEVADVVVWEGNHEQYGEKVRSIVDRLLEVKRPIQLNEQLIHGDMTGNILFHDSLPPAIIDFSPYWRPAEYATAIIIVDAIVWEGSDDSLFSTMDNTFENNQLLIRAALWRIKTTDVFSTLYGSDPTKEILNYTHFIDALLNRIEKETR